MRLITVVMGEPSSKVRNAETTSMLDYGFNTYKMDNILPKDKIITKTKVELGTKEKVNIIPKEDISILNSKTGTKRNITYKLKLNKISAPIKKGDKVGKINIIENNKIIMTKDATVSENINKANIITVYLRNLLNIATGKI